MSRPLTVAIVQASGVLFDLESTIDRFEELTRQAANSGASFVLFPEAFIGGYPRGLNFGTVVGDRSEMGKEVWLAYSNSCPRENGPEIDRMKSIARANEIYVAAGVIEKSALSGSLYCSILYFSPAGELVGRHRKLKPTAAERIIWSDSNPEDSLAVIDTPLGRIGGLICWENYMPLARMAIYQQGVDIYLAPTADQRKRWQSSMIHIAMESRSYVLSANQFATKKDIDSNWLAKLPELEKFPSTICRGGSLIIDPAGNVLAGPVWDKKDILIQNIDLEQIQKSKMDFDVIGHYSRNDVLSLKVNKKTDETD